MNERRRRELLEELAKCMRCGFCQAACPVYREEGTEFSVARGKLILIEAVLDGRSALTPAIRDALGACLLCKSCRAACPSGVRTDLIMAAGREMAADRYGLGLVKANALAVLRRPKALRLATALGTRLWPMAFAREADGGLWRLRIPPGNLYPRLPRRSFVARLTRGELGAVAEPKSGTLVVGRASAAKTGVFFPGCLVSYMLPDVGLAAVKVLVAAGTRVAVPLQPACCGTPLYVNGERSGAASSAAANLTWLSQSGLTASPIVFACPSCAESWRGYPDLVEGRSAGPANEAAGRVVDISVFLSRFTPEIFRRAVSRRLTYYDTCHLAQAQGVRSEPRALLTALPGVSFKEMADPGACCGSGGTFGLFHADLARRIGGKKAADIAATGADTVATGCPACLLQLGQELRVAGRPQVAVRHTVELLAEALGDG